MTWTTYNPIKQMAAHYADKVSDSDVVIPTTDPEAWNLFDEYRWVYDLSLIHI